jgi:hypothetical protein
MVSGLVGAVKYTVRESDVAEVSVTVGAAGAKGEIPITVGDEARASVLFPFDAAAVAKVEKKTVDGARASAYVMVATLPLLNVSLLTETVRLVIASFPTFAELMVTKPALVGFFVCGTLQPAGTTNLSVPRETAAAAV